jgi:hypothetical protein
MLSFVIVTSLSFVGAILVPSIAAVWRKESTQGHRRLSAGSGGYDRVLKMTEVALAASLLTPFLLLGNDGSGGTVPAGGIQLRREARISMEKERLTIGMERIAVEYEFLNTTGRDITTEVLFPLPGFNLTFSPRPLGIDGWRVWVEGKELQYSTDIRARTKGVDRTDLLRRFSIDIESFGHFNQQPDGKITDDIDKLPKTQQEELARAGLSESGDFPTWTVFKTYHWRQTFPAHKIVHVKHEYQPASGLRYLNADSFRGDNQDLSSSCVDPSLRKTLLAAAPNNHGFVLGSIDTLWVDYILTTANTWKTPIKDFELIVETPKAKGHERYYVSLCWDGKLEKGDADTLVTRVRNFVPKRELRVMFFPVVN